MKKICLLVLLLPFCAKAQIITTLAGIDSSAYCCDGGPATAALMVEPICARPDGVGNVYIADYNGSRIRKINTSGIITTIAGNGTAGSTGDGSPATAAEVNRPLSVTPDSAGNVYITEWGSGRIRKISTTGIITTVAGGGASTAEGVPATTAALSPYDVAFDRAGNMYIADQTHARIRMVNTSGIINTIAGTGTLGHLGDGGPATAAQLISPLAITLDAGGNIYFVDASYIRKINTLGVITTIGGGASSGYTGDGIAATAALFNAPNGIAVDAAGNVYVGDRANSEVRKINTAGIVTALAGSEATGAGYGGDGGPATAALLAQPMGIGIDHAGSIYIADAANSRVRKVWSLATGLHNPTMITLRYHIFPNPAANFINIVSEEKIDKVVISDIVGGEVLTRVFDSEHVQIDICFLPQGIYFIKVNEFEVGRFVKD